MSKILFLPQEDKIHIKVKTYVSGINFDRSIDQ